VNVLVIPTARPELLLEFCREWAPWPWDHAIVIEDAPRVTIEREAVAEAAGDRGFDVYSWAEIEAELPDPAIISRRDSAIRGFGFWKAWQRGAEVIATLDDDCYPHGDGFIESHRRNLERTPRWSSTVPGLRVRGLPYRNVGRLNAAVSMGLWDGNPDLDAVQTLANGITEDDVRLVTAAGTRVLPSEQYFPISSMNLAVRGAVACLMYYPPMGLGSPFSRFDDIWCGLVLQRVCRHLRLSIVCGSPLVDHRRASDPFVNLEKEGTGIGANERVWELIDAIELTASTPLGAMREVGLALERAGEHDEYAGRWGRAIQGWCELFAEPS
jgi:Reversibly glycosylated polypeptide